MNDRITLYTFIRCPFAIRVRMVLHEKNIPFETHEEDLKNFSDALKALHPQAKVPVLVHGENVIYESAIITEYLDEAFPEIPLMPEAPEDRARVRLWTHWCNNLFKPDIDRLKYGSSRFTEAECVGIEKKVVAHVEKLENRLSRFSWLEGENISLADLHLFPLARQLLNIKPSPPFLAAYPAITQWVERIEARPSFTKTMSR